MQRTVRALVLVAACAAVPAGCRGTGPGASPYESRELSLAQFDDVPVPEGMALDVQSGKSFSYAEGGDGEDGLRVARLEYYGTLGPDAVLSWYEGEMPRSLHGWKAGTRADRASGETGILFTRGRERCLVTVRRTDSGSVLVVERNTGGAARS